MSKPTRASPSTPSPTPPAPRDALRRTLLSARAAFATSAAFGPAEEALQRHLVPWLDRLEPTMLGLYWPIRGEFSAGVSPWAPCWPAGTPLALPAASRARPDGTAAAMVYRRLQGPDIEARDEYGLPTGDGPPCDPDVLLVPCVGFTADGHRLGYGGGYFDRYRAAHPGVTAVGIAWSAALIEPGLFEAQAHERPLDLILTENGLFDPG